MLQLYIKKQKNDEVICSLAWDIIFTDYWKVLVLNFSVIGNTVFFESRSWWKDDIYWLPRSSYFELFGNWKYGLFSAKRLIERWYLLGLFELSMTFQGLGNMAFRAVQIVISDKFKHNNESFKYFIGYQEGEFVQPLWIILPRISGYMKYFEYGNKNMSFLIKDDEVREKSKQIWDVIKNKLKIKFHSLPVYDKKYLKTNWENMIV